MDKVFVTNFGVLKGVSVCDTYGGTALRDCALSKRNVVKTPYGELMPQYEDNGIRRKNLQSLSFFENGNIKYISLQNQSTIETPIGPIKAEYLSFYDDMTLRRIFPLSGKLSGYWSEEDEYELAEDLELDLPIGKLQCKVISIHFYRSGKLKSITFWPKSKVEISTSLGLIPTRIGISFYENGNLKSLEPRIPIKIATPIGVITAYDLNANGINGDINSLCFSETGEIEGLTTSSDLVQVTDSHGFIRIYKPELRPSFIGDDELEVVPMRIYFSGNKVSFNDSDEFEINKCRFLIKKAFEKLHHSCSSCSSCTGCS